MKISDLRVKTRLMLGFAAIAAIVLLVSALALQSLGASNARFANYLAGVGARERLAVDIRGAATRRAIAARNLVLVSEPKDVELEKAAVLKAHDEVGTAFERLNKAVAAADDVTDRDRALVAEMVRIEALYAPVATDIVGKALGGQKDAAIARMNADCRPLLAAFMRAITSRWCRCAPRRCSSRWRWDGCWPRRSPARWSVAWCWPRPWPPAT